MDVWKELHRFAEERGFDTVETSLLGDVPWSLKDGVGVSHIPAWLAEDAKKHGFEIVAADWKRGCYTLRLLRPNVKLRDAEPASSAERPSPAPGSTSGTTGEQT